MESNEFRLEDLTHFPLFEGIQASELEALLPCLDGYIRSYPRNSFLILDEDSVPYVGMLLSGMVFMLKEDENGHQSFLNYMLPGELFGESFSLRKKKTPSHVSFLAARNATALFLPLGKIMRSCEHHCRFHRIMNENLYALLAKKNAHLMQTLDFLAKDTRVDFAEAVVKQRGSANCLESAEQIRTRALPEREPDLPLPRTRRHGKGRNSYGQREPLLASRLLTKNAADTQRASRSPHCLFCFFSSQNASAQDCRRCIFACTGKSSHRQLIRCRFIRTAWFRVNCKKSPETKVSGLFSVTVIDSIPQSPVSEPQGTSEPDSHRLGVISSELLRISLVLLSARSTAACHQSVSAVSEPCLKELAEFRNFRRGLGNCNGVLRRSFDSRIVGDGLKLKMNALLGRRAIAGPAGSNLTAVLLVENLGLAPLGKLPVHRHDYNFTRLVAHNVVAVHIDLNNDGIVRIFHVAVNQSVGVSVRNQRVENLSHLCLVLPVVLIGGPGQRLLQQIL